MYTYEGKGYCIAFDYDTLDEFVEAYASVTNEYVEDIYDIDERMSLGDWCSEDNVDDAYLNGYTLDVGAGVLVLRDGYGDRELLEQVCEQLGWDLEQFHGTFTVNCWD